MEELAHNLTKTRWTDGGAETRRAWESLPPEMLQQAEKRLPVVSATTAVLLLIGWFLPNLLRDNIGYELTHVLQGGPPAAVMVVSLLIFALCRLKRLAGHTLVRIGLVYQVLVTIGLTLSQHWGAFEGVPAQSMTGDRVGLAHAIIWVFLYAALVPARPRESWIALFASCAAIPGVYIASTLAGVSPSLPGWTLFNLFIFPYVICYAVLVLMTRIIFRLGVDVRHAKEMGSYRLEKVLGRGGMGEVWRASHRMLARPAAVKLIRAEALGSEPSKAESVLTRFEREAQVTAQLQSPHTVALFDFGRSQDGALYYVMELLDGINLDTLVTKHGKLPVRRAVHILRQICSSLAEAHAHGLVHRDIKPANIFLCKRGLQHDFVKVLDFGLVRRTAPQDDDAKAISRTDALVGTPGFIAPEVVLGNHPVDARTDLYAVGCVGYWLLTGRLVFVEPTLAGTLAAHAYKEPEPPSKYADEPVPAALESLITRCLAKEPSNRPASAQVIDDVLAELDVPPWTEQEAKLCWRDLAPQDA